MIQSILRTRLFNILFCLGLSMLTVIASSAQPSNISKGEKKTAPSSVMARFEHIAFNVPDPVAMAAWYTKNLGMKIMRSGPAPTFTTFVADSGLHMMVEFTHDASVPLFGPAKIHFTSIHLAFVTPDMGKTQKQLVGAGATIVDSLRKNPSGDEVLVFRDPWGLAIQFIRRVNPMLSFAGLYPEHFAINVADSRAKARWYVDHLGMVLMRDVKAPTYGMFIADAGKNMMYELYQYDTIPVVDFSAVSHLTFHAAYMVDDIQSAKDVLVAVGAKVVEDITTLPSGDNVLMLRDPWNQPIQFVKRVQPMIQ